MKIRRSVFAYLIPLSWLGLMSFSISNSSPAFGYLFIFASIFWIAQLAFIVIYPYVFVIDDGRLHCYFTWFHRKEISLSDIRVIDLSPWPFSSSIICLNDGSKLKFDNSLVAEKRFKNVFGRLDIPVT